MHGEKGLLTLFWAHGGVKASLQIPSVAQAGIGELLHFNEERVDCDRFQPGHPGLPTVTSVTEPGLGQRPVSTLPGEQAEWLGIFAPNPETVLEGGHQAFLKGH